MRDHLPYTARVYTNTTSAAEWCRSTLGPRGDAWNVSTLREGSRIQWYTSEFVFKTEQDRTRFLLTWG